MNTYYVTEKDGFLKLRQTRFREQLTKGKEHPHDVCAVARNREELQGMYDAYLSGGIDWND